MMRRYRYDDLICRERQVNKDSRILFHGLQSVIWLQERLTRLSMYLMTSLLNVDVVGRFSLDSCGRKLLMEVTGVGEG